MSSAPKAICAKCGPILTTSIQVPSFPVPDLIHNSRTPSQAEVELVRETLSEVRADISHLDEEIRRLREITNDLLRVQEALSKYTKENEAILTPIERLPPELL